MQISKYTQTSLRQKDILKRIHNIVGEETDETLPVLNQW